MAISNPGKVLWPQTGFTKGDMLAYYRRIAPVLLPHIERRPLTLARFPDGVTEGGWYQLDCRGAPEWLGTYDLDTQIGRRFRMCLVDDVRSLEWVVNLGTVELHPFSWTADRPGEASFVVFDLDPGRPATLVDACRVALALRGLLDERGLRSVAKVSGGAGLHVYVPVSPGHTHERAKRFAGALAARLAERYPEEVVTKASKSLRAGRVFVDWLQNERMRSMISPYSLRAMAAPLVSAPVTWREVESAAAGEPPAFSPPESLHRVERVGDLFAEVLTGSQELPDDDEEP